MVSPTPKMSDAAGALLRRTAQLRKKQLDLVKLPPNKARRRQIGSSRREYRLLQYHPAAPEVCGWLRNHLQRYAEFEKLSAGPVSYVDGKLVRTVDETVLITQSGPGCVIPADHVLSAAEAEIVCPPEFS